MTDDEIVTLGSFCETLMCHSAWAVIVEQLEQHCFQRSWALGTKKTRGALCARTTRAKMIRSRRPFRLSFEVRAWVSFLRLAAGGGPIFVAVRVSGPIVHGRSVPLNRDRRDVLRLWRTRDLTAPEGPLNSG